MSMDAGLFGNRLGVEDAYRFARGEEVMASSGQKAKLSRPLDFLVVSDHSDNMGFAPDLIAGKPELLEDPTGKKWYDMIQAGQDNAAALELIDNFSRGTLPDKLMYGPTRHRTPRRGSSRSMRRRSTTSLASSRLSSATSGPRRCRPATTCIASWSIATAATRRFRPSRTPPIHRRAAPRRRISGRRCRPTRTRPADRCWPSHTTAISPTAGCSPGTSTRPASSR